jgi:hypothetical protein
MSVTTLDSILICAGLIILVVGLLSLATFEPMIFVFCNYVGVILLLTGVFAKLDLIPATLNSRNGVVALLFFASGLLFVTGVNMLFIDVKAYAQPTRFAFTSANKLCLTFIRPYAYLFQPLIEAGAVVLIMALTLTFLDNVR